MSKDDVVWTAEPHTLVKHRVYQAYLSKWMPIMIRGWGGDITYAEGFSGPGIYTGKQPGSPVIALRTLLDSPGLRTTVRRLRFLFVEERRDRSDWLRQQLEKAARPVALPDLGKYGIDLAIKTGTCDPELVNLLDRHGAWGRPMLVVLDTYGGGVRLDLVRRIVENPSSEVIITFEPQHFTRFASAESVTDGDMVFGDPDWRRVADLPPEEKNRWVI
ncbi:MAG: three-Cys-motif partner protein TcmP, partial [Microlunatus sp.]|nr:three-Cys-motif partner protein TcmP [Microlunatus sp.]